MGDWQGGRTSAIDGVRRLEGQGRPAGGGVGRCLAGVRAAHRRRVPVRHDSRHPSGFHRQGRLWPGPLLCHAGADVSIREGSGVGLGLRAGLKASCRGVFRPRWKVWRCTCMVTSFTHGLDVQHLWMFLSLKVHFNREHACTSAWLSEGLG